MRRGSTVPGILAALLAAAIVVVVVRRGWLRNVRRSIQRLALAALADVFETESS